MDTTVKNLAKRPLVLHCVKRLGNVQEDQVNMASLFDNLCTREMNCVSYQRPLRNPCWNKDMVEFEEEKKLDGI